MPSVDIPDMVDDSKNGQLNEKNNTDNDLVDAFSPLSCNDKPTNGSNGSVMDDDDDNRKLFVGGLSWETNENDLKEYFSRWGNVTQCIIKLDRFTGNSRGFGFVTMENEECVSEILNVPDHWLNNKKIDPKKAKPYREPLKKVFVGGIDPEISGDQIREYFSTFGKIEALDLPFDVSKGKRKHYIFVSFATEAAARKAISKEKQEILGRQCDVRAAVTREEANRQKAVKKWFNWFDPTFTYPGFTYNDYTPTYPSFDPIAYNYYGYDYYGNPTSAVPGYNPYTAIAPNQFRGLINATKVSPQNMRSSGSLAVTNHILNHSGISNQQSHTPHNAHQHHQSQQAQHMNFTGLLDAHNRQAQQQNHHHSSSMGGGLDFSIAHPSQAAGSQQQQAVVGVGAAGSASGYSIPQ